MPYHGKYIAPSDLAHDKDLSRDEKIALLKAWRDDKNALLRASEEGMQGDDPSDILRKIKILLAQLNEEPPV